MGSDLLSVEAAVLNEDFVCPRSRNNYPRHIDSGDIALQCYRIAHGPALICRKLDSHRTQKVIIGVISRHGEDEIVLQTKFALRRLDQNMIGIDLANEMRIPGEDLPKVFHYYREPHPYFDTDVLVIGGKNSAAISALDLWRHGARVTLVHRGPRMHNHVKYWILPDIENRIKNGEIAAYFNSAVTEIDPDHVLIETPQGKLRLKNDFVFAMTGYHPDYDFLRSMGIELSADQCRPVCDPVTLESNVPGIYVAGVIVAGSRTNEIFIENGRFHGQQIAAHLKQILTG